MIFLAGSDPFLCAQPSCLPSVFNVSPTRLRAQNKKSSNIFYRPSSGSSRKTIKQRVSICFQFVRDEHLSLGFQMNFTASNIYLFGWCYRSRSGDRIRFYRIDSNPLFVVVMQVLWLNSNYPTTLCHCYRKFRFHMRTTTELSSWQLTQCCYISKRQSQLNPINVFNTMRWLQTIPVTPQHHDDNLKSK